MKIQPINNNQHQHTNSTNFNGKLILPEKMSNIGKQFVDKCGERITKILEPEPYDMFLHEIPVNKWREVVRILLKRCNREKHK